MNSLIDRKIAIIDVLRKYRRSWIGHVVHHDAADPLQRDERIGSLADLTDRHALWLRPFLTAAVVESILVGLGVEEIRACLIGQCFELRAAVEDTLPTIGQN